MDRAKSIQLRILICIAFILLAGYNSNQCYSLNKKIVKEIARSNKSLIISSIMAVGAVAIYAIRQYKKSQSVKNSAAPAIHINAKNRLLPSITITATDDDDQSLTPVAINPYIPCATPEPKTPQSPQNQSLCMARIIDNFNAAIENFNGTFRFKMLYQGRNSPLWEHNKPAGFVKEDYEDVQQPVTLSVIPDNQWHTIVQAHTNIQDYCWKYSYLFENLDHNPGRTVAINTLLKCYGERIQEILPTLVQQAHGMNPDIIVSAQKRIITQYELLFETLCETSIVTEETKGKVSLILNDLKALLTH